MATPDTINVAQLARLIGTPDTPVIVDVRIDTDHASDSRMLPASIRRDYHAVSSWADEYAGQFVVVICQRGQKLSQGAAAWLRHAGARAESLEGGFEAWVESKGLLVRPDGSSADSSILPQSSFSSHLPRSWTLRTGFGQRHSTSKEYSGAIGASSAPSM
jgi:rhodanese-related sulfurtransferase